MSERYFIEQPLGKGSVTIDGAEAHHLVTVCRLRPGDTVRLFNGDGREYPAVVDSAGRRSVTLDVGEGEPVSRELNHRLEVAAPLPKGDRAIFLIEKLTELGVTAFTPLQTTRSVVLPREAKLNRLQRHVIEASKQCGRNILMEIRPLQQLRELLFRDDLPTGRALAHVGGDASPVLIGDAIVAVGPEGGFTEEEIEQAKAAGWRVVGLGRRILRVESAAIALAILNSDLNAIATNTASSAT